MALTPQSVQRQKVLEALVCAFKTVPDVEGVFLGGSLANRNRDRYSDIDFGIATENSAKAFFNVYGLRRRLMAAVGTPVASLDRGWEHCKMTAALYSKNRFPPIGLEIDFIFSQLRFVSEQMPDSDYKILFDRNGKLKRVLAKSRLRNRSRDIERQLGRHLNWYPFYLHDALKAVKRSDVFQAQSLLEEMRKLVFFAAATLKGEQVYGSKWAYRHLTRHQRATIAKSYLLANEKSIREITRVYLECLCGLQSKHRLAKNLKRLRTAIGSLQ
ncbi:MAG TPA: nucleotidyltransferase domain-containing protein [Verrucomicrobiae bacterium]|nr:nucleotidyltransferase domain-containing protein [Verrucomicrobiae bacterium]